MLPAAVAAIIPVFNRPRAVVEALDSVLAQTLPPAKLVVVDDGSTDDTAVRVEEWIAAKRPPFEARLVRQPNSGAATARNRGVAEAPGCDLLAFLDSDDLWPADYLRRVTDAFASAPDAVAASVDRVNHDFATGEVSPHSYAHYARDPRNVTTIIFMEGPPGTPNTVVRVGAFQQAGGFDARWPTGQDYDLLLRVSLLGRWLHVPGTPVTTRNHLEVLTGSGEPPLSRKFDDRVFRRVQMLDRFIFEGGGKAVVPEKLWRGRLTELWFRAGRKLAALGRADDARICFHRTVKLRPWHLLAWLRLYRDAVTIMIPAIAKSLGAARASRYHSLDAASRADTSRPMKLGFVLFDYFPFGGLERDCFRIASLCAEAGHDVTFFTRTWQGEQPSNMKVELFGRHGFTIPARNRHFVWQLDVTLPCHALDGVIGFNKLPGLDVYYGADPCYAAALDAKPFWKRWLPRYRQYAEFERAVFQRGARTVILQYIPRDIPTYQKFYGTEDRFHVLPPNARRHAFAAGDQPAARRRVRQENGWAVDDVIVLFVGSDFQRKGLDRVIRALAALEPGLRARARVAVLGRDEPGRFARLANQLGVGARVHFLGGRHDVPDWMLAADAMAHPARSENTGSVLVEALSFGLPVLATDVCGYAPHITAARAGWTFAEPFDQATFDRALQEALSTGTLAGWSRNAWAYAATGAIFGCHERAAEIIIETIARRRHA